MLPTHRFHRPGAEDAPMTTPASQRPAWEVADVIRQHGEAFLVARRPADRRAEAGVARPGPVPHGGPGRARLALPRLRIRRIAYNSCRNRHCPKCQARARARWLAGGRESVAGRVLPRGLYPAGRGRRVGPGQSAPALRPVVPGGRRHAPDRGGEPKGLGAASVCCWRCTRGGKTCIIIRMCMAL